MSNSDYEQRNIENKINVQTSLWEKVSLIEPPINFIAEVI